MYTYFPHPMDIHSNCICLFKVLSARAYSKIAFRQLCVVVCGRLVPNYGHIAGYLT
ncbi:DUF6783 domain-containing protein [uncultured Robinsoniella sp.]|uniref:DUF6783 domain-containing protein n=1 Tax=Robinsoniella sp. TaxID=2496533 RepID=UPI00374EC09F